MGTRGYRPRYSRAELESAITEHGSQAAAARALGLSEAHISKVYKEIRESKPSDFEVAELPAEDIPTGELLALRKKHFLTKSKAKEARRLIPVTVNVAGPIGIAHFGDPHVDDDGTNIIALERHVEIVNKTDGLFAGNSGDTTNNWVGRLAHLYGQQGTTARQAWQLAEWLFTAMPWLFAIGGNHDLWSGDGDPLKWIARQAGVMYHAHGIRLSLNLPSGRSIIINARHRWTGKSQWNAAHGVSKAVQLGHHDHIVTAGDLHVSGYQVLRDPATRRISHALQIASYKTYDRYAEERGFPDQNVFVCPVTIIDPSYEDTDPRFITTLFDPGEGAEYLTWKRKRAGVHGGRRGKTRTA
jgi:hypothetical protein